MDPERDTCDVTSLVRRAAEDDDAFAALVRRHQDGVHRVCLRILASPDLASDAAQETFVNVHRHLAASDASDASRPFRPWLYRIAVNTSLSMRRASARQTAALAGFARQLRTRTTPTSRPGPTPQQEALLELVDTLPEKARAMLQLRFAEGFGVAEIAEVFDMTPNAVSVALYRAKKRVIDAAREAHDEV